MDRPVQINIKPLSVNDAWQGRRFKTEKYKAFEKAVLFCLPNGIQIPQGPKSIYFTFGISNPKADIDNPVKVIQDILQKKYKFNDSEIYRAVILKQIVPKGKEYFRFFLEPFGKYL